MAAKRVEIEIEIAASPEQVWSVLTDLARWGEWNRIMPAIKGTLAEGSRVDLELALPGRRSAYQKPRITRVSPNQELRWYDQVLHPWIFASEHWFHLEATSRGCLVRHGEQFDGILTALMGTKTLDQTRRIFALMNRDLKDRVESLR